MTGTLATPTGTLTYNFYNTSTPTYGVTTPTGTETVTLSGGLVPNSSLSAALTAGSYSYIGYYSGDSNFNGFAGAVEPLSIGKGTASESTTIYDSSSGPVTGAYGEQVYDTATVTGTLATPTGTLTYNFYNTLTPTYGVTTPSSTQTVALSGGLVPNSSLSAALTAGSYSYIGYYSGDSNFNGFAGAVEPLSIGKGTASESTTIYDSSGSGVTGAYGEQVYDTATVTGTLATPTGTLTYNFYNTSTPTYGVTIPTGTETVTLSGGLVPNSALTAALTAGSYSFIGYYSGDSNYGGFAGAVEPLSIGKGTASESTTIYDSSSGPVTGAYGEQVYDTATVTGTLATPTGTLTYNFYSTSTPTYGVTTPTGTETVTLSGGLVPNSSLSAALTAGSYSYIGYYSGDSNFNGFAGAVEPLSIGKGTASESTTIYDSSSGPVTGAYGEQVYDTATVTGTLATPTGTLTYNFYNTSTPTYGVTIPTGTETVTLSGGLVPNSSLSAALTAGSYSYIGYYSGDSNFSGFAGAVEPLSIGKGTASESTTIHDSGGGSVTGLYGEKVYDTATVTGTLATPTGTLTYNFYNTSTPTYGVTTPTTTQTVTLSGGLVPNSSLSAALTTGSYSYIGYYSGDSNFNGFPGAVEPLSIGKGTASESTTIYDSSSGSVTGAYGEQVYDTATVTGTLATPTGTVTYNFYNTSTPTYGVTIPTGTETVTLSGGLVPNSSLSAALTAGSYSYIGYYSGDSNFSGFAGAVEPLSIGKGTASESTTIHDSGGGSVTGLYGEHVYDTATVTGTLATPTGTLTYNFYNTSTPTYGVTTPTTTQTVTLSGGLVPNSALSAALTAGSYSYIGYYSGDSNFGGFAGAVEPLSIGKGTASESTTIHDSGGGSVTGLYGEKVYDTATVTGTLATPTGTVTYNFYNTSTPTYGVTTPTTTQTVTLSGGLVPNSSLSAALTAGSYSYIGYYSGDSNFGGFAGAVEPLSIGKGTVSESTTIYDSGGGPVTGLYGEQVYDTATVTGTLATPTGTVTYNFYNTSTPTYGVTTPTTTQTVTLSGGLVPNSALSAALTAGSYSYIGYYSGDSNFSGFAGAVEPLSIGKGTASESTTIHDSGGGSVTGVYGEKVYDTATVTGTLATPTGTVTYNFYNTSTPTYGVTTPTSTQTVTLSGGLVPNSAVTSALAAGSYSYIGYYSGDSNFGGFAGAVEPLTIVGKASSSVSTTVLDSTGCSVTGALGEKVYDTATVKGTSITPTGTVTYYFYATATPVYDTTTPSTTQTVTLNGSGVVPNSSTTSALAAGSFAYIAVYSGDGNYNGSTGSVEPLTINKASSSVSTTIVDSTGCSVTGATGEKVYDTATVTATPITPTGTVSV